MELIGNVLIFIMAIIVSPIMILSLLIGKIIELIYDINDYIKERKRKNDTIKWRAERKKEISEGKYDALVRSKANPMEKDSYKYDVNELLSLAIEEYQSNKSNKSKESDKSNELYYKNKGNILDIIQKLVDNGADITINIFDKKSPILLAKNSKTLMEILLNQKEEYLKKSRNQEVFSTIVTHNDEIRALLNNVKERISPTSASSSPNKLPNTSKIVVRKAKEKFD